MDLDGMDAFITGGTSGVGRTTAHLSVRAGATVAISGRDGDRGPQAAADTGRRFVRADLTCRDDVRRLTVKAGVVDVLVNDAGF